MKRVFLLIVVPALLIALGFAQTPTASSNTDQINVKGCLGGSDGKYTVAEDNTGQIFKITTSSADLKPHLGHNVKLIGHKAGGAVSSGTAENSLAVTEVNMISEHCTAAAAAPAATVSTTPETISSPATSAAAAPTAAPAATVSTSGETVSTPPAAAAVQPTPPSARPRKLSATPAAAAAPAETVSTPVAAAPAAPVGTPSETASTPPAAATKPATSASGGSLWMLVSLVVVVLLIGALVPLFNRWRKRKLLEQTSAENLSFTNEASFDQGKSDKPAGHKAA